MEFLADEHRAAEANIRASDFEGQIYSAYEQLFNVWLQSKEAAKEARVSWLIFHISAPTDIHVLFFLHHLLPLPLLLLSFPLSLSFVWLWQRQLVFLSTCVRQTPSTSSYPNSSQVLYSFTRNTPTTTTSHR